jgi:hypothetical protein
MNTTSTKSPARIKLEAAIAAKPTDVLLCSHGMLEAKANPLPEERLTMALIADCIEARHNLTDAMNEIFGDLDYTGTYHEALLMAMVTTGADLL